MINYLWISSEASQVPAGPRCLSASQLCVSSRCLIHEIQLFAEVVPRLLMLISEVLLYEYSCSLRFQNIQNAKLFTRVMSMYMPISLISCIPLRMCAPPGNGSFGV